MSSPYRPRWLRSLAVTGSGADIKTREAATAVTSAIKHSCAEKWAAACSNVREQADALAACARAEGTRPPETPPRGGSHTSPDPPFLAPERLEAAASAFLALKSSVVHALALRCSLRMAECLEAGEVTLERDLERELAQLDARLAGRAGGVERGAEYMY